MPSSTVTCPDCKGEGRIVTTEADEADCLLCEGNGSIDPAEYLATNRLRLIRETLEAAPGQTAGSAALSVMAKLKRIQAENTTLKADLARRDTDGFQAWKDRVVDLLVMPFRGKWEAPCGPREVQRYPSKEEATAAFMAAVDTFDLDAYLNPKNVC